MFRNARTKRMYAHILPGKVLSNYLPGYHELSPKWDDKASWRKEVEISSSFPLFIRNYSKWMPEIMGIMNMVYVSKYHFHVKKEVCDFPLAYLSCLQHRFVLWSHYQLRWGLLEHEDCDTIQPLCNWDS